MGLATTDNGKNRSKSLRDDKQKDKGKSKDNRKDNGKGKSWLGKGIQSHLRRDEAAPKVGHPFVCGW